MIGKRWLVAALMVVIGASSARPVDAQFRKGFPPTTKEVFLNRKRAPKVYLMGTTIRVEGLAQNPALADAAKQIGTVLEAELTSHDSRLVPVRDKPQTAIAVTLVQIDTGRVNETRKETVTKQTGTKNGKPVYGPVEEYHTYVVVTGKVSATYQVRDTTTGAILDSDTLSPEYRQDFLNGVGAPDTDVVRLELLKAIGDSIVTRVTPTYERVKVLLARPNDEIDDINNLAQRNLWDRNLERLMATKALLDPKKEAYRQYNLGVANEALAYAAQELTTSKRLLEEASGYYNRAIEGKPDEKYFSEPQTRIAEAIAGYTTLHEMITKYEEMRKATATAAATSPPPTGGTRALTPSSTTPPSTAWNNAAIIGLKNKGLDDANLIEAIKLADSVAFDFSPNGLGDLLTAKISNPVISAMRAKQAGAAPGNRGSRAPATRGGRGRSATGGATAAPASQAPAASPKPVATPAAGANAPGKPTPAK